MKQHELSLDGVHGFVMSVRDGGQQITVSGWCDDHGIWQDGDRFLLRRKDGRTTRYRALSIRHCHDPADQYFMDMQFEPREQPVREPRSVEQYLTYPKGFR